jgi:hypothetical protein
MLGRKGEMGRMNSFVFLLSDFAAGDKQAFNSGYFLLFLYCFLYFNLHTHVTYCPITARQGLDKDSTT